MAVTAPAGSGGRPLILPLAAAAGAIRLDNGHSNAVAVGTVAAIVIALSVSAALSARLDKALLEMVLYAAGVAMVWASSLRGDPLYGFDIATEYQRLQHTVATGIWLTPHPNDAYGAMLSVTVMPAELHALSGVPALLIFKVIYPMIYALFPVAIFGLARKILTRPWAFIAAAFTIGQYAFTELAGFARQEIALVLFAALLAAMLDNRIPRWAPVAAGRVARRGAGAVALLHYVRRGHRAGPHAGAPVRAVLDPPGAPGDRGGRRRLPGHVRRGGHLVRPGDPFRFASGATLPRRWMPRA